jgi:arylsulfatase A-like enzyme
MRVLCLSVCFLWALAAHCGVVQAVGQPPNIVLVLTDDQSWNGTSVQMDPSRPNSKSDFYQTPRLEELAAAGMRFSNGYSSAPVCAPTRAAIQTGMSPAQLQMTDLHFALPPGSVRWEGGYTNLPLTPPAPLPFDPNLYTLPRIIKDSNPDYVTAHFNKWHLDFLASTTPQATGYDFAQAVVPLPNDEIDP